jgi:hypothetical protein
MLFECPDDISSSGFLIMKIDTFRQQRIIARLNGAPILDEIEDGTRLSLRIAVENLNSGLNSLEFRLPDSDSPGNGDNRRLGIAVRSFRVQIPYDQAVTDTED